MNELKINFDHKEYSIAFFGIAFISVVFGLVLGGLIDASFRNAQKDGEWKDRTYAKSSAYFAMQSSANILVLLAFTKTTIYFVPWLQLSVSGALFAVLLFTCPRNLVDNALRITNF